MDEDEYAAERQERAWNSYLWEPGGSVLRNLWGERDGEVLRAREYAEVAKRQLQIERGDVVIPRTYDADHLRAIHGHLFGNVYEWAGQNRHAQMAKGFAGDAVTFAKPEVIDAVMSKATDVVRETDWPATDRAQFAEAIAKTYSIVNFAHPFREGNGRTAKIFLQHVAEQSPWQLEYDVLDVDPDPGEPSARDLWNLTSALTILQADANGPRSDIMNAVFRGLAVPRPVVEERPERQETAEMSTLDLYHRTTPEAAATIVAEGRFVTRENTPEAYVSTHAVSDATEGYGDAVVHVRVEESLAELDDEFPDGEQHFRIPLDRAQVVGAFTVGDDGQRTPITAGGDAELHAAQARRAIGNPTPAAGAVAATPEQRAPAPAPPAAGYAVEQTTDLEADR